MEPELGLHIDLYNLEDVKFEGSKYVLTSPRSLEACSRLDVKPIELLYKPLSEFQEELLPQDIPLRTIYTLYDESEEIRQKKLRLCREERKRILESELKKESTLSRDIKLSTLPSEDALAKQKKQKSALSPTKAVGFRSSYASRILKKSADRESTKLHRELVSKKEKNPPRARSTIRTRPQSADRRRPQRCAPSVTKGSRVRVRSGSAPNARLPDQKILKLMKDRRDEERKDLQASTEARRLWEDQKKREEALRTIAENKRRQLLAEENRIRDRRKFEEKERIIQAEEEERELKRLAVKDSQLNAEIALMNQLRMKELQLSDKIQKETAKAEIHELNLKAKEKEDEEIRQLLLAKQITDVNSATERKDVRLHQESLKKFLDNRQERELHEKRKHFIENQERQNQAVMQSSMASRLNQAESNLSVVLEQRNKQLEEQRRAEQEKLHRARKAHRRMEAEMDAWRHGLLEHKKMMESRASEVVNKSLELKSWQVKKDRMNRQTEQKRNISKIHKEVERWRSDLEKSLCERDRKVEDLLEEKERTISETRAMAQISQTMRDDIKERYVSDTFDKKALEAQLYANLYSSHRSRSPSLKNRSSIKIC
ncbi:coiled-coil domain-containing protein 177 isoform X2 [Aplysia californica]|uniref:Coiled-coil domain-containing protein 177 isoform X2 n=1 Tax=Aplysia californica TaxID=6500 RepID=A0ABM1AG47_APLCA|nr:coiled-coil domain-containing protein 177 isoform X2 [Aplysia californica]